MSVPQFSAVRRGVEQRCPGDLIPRHRHRSGYVALALSGDYEEAGEDGYIRVDAGVVVFHGPFHAHNNRIGSKGAVILNLEIAEWSTPTFPYAQISDVDEVVRLSEINPTDAMDFLLETVIPVEAPATDWPQELAISIKRDPGLSLADWSRARGLAPAQLSRGFAQVFGIPPASYRSQMRARQAWYRLMTDATSLAGAATDAGFADQPHMTRAVRALTGRTPGSWKNQIRSRQAPSIHPMI